MGRWLWIGVACCLAAPAAAAEVRCSDDGGVVMGTDAKVVLVAVDDRIHVLRPDAAPGEPGSADDFCVGRQGLVAIVLPAPKPGPDDEVPDEGIELPAELDDLGEPLGADGPAEGEPGSTDAEGDAEEQASGGTYEPAPTLARTRSGSLPADLLADELPGCQAAPLGGPSSLALLMIALVGLRRKRGAR